jgi:hypothetical protein
METKSKGVTRRRAIASSLAAAPAAAVAMAQQPAVEDLDTAAREGVKRTSATLRKLKVPIATEPVFVFRA